MKNYYDVIIIGGGAGGFFTAVNLARGFSEKKLLIIEKNKEPLTKLRVSGGGRCNVTNVIATPSELVQYYPRGGNELRSSFHRFTTTDTISWFEQQGVALYAQPDGRVFPKSDSSQSIIDCFLNEAKRLHIPIRYGEFLVALEKTGKTWHLTTNHAQYEAEKVILSTGSNAKIWTLVAKLGHHIVPPVPSLFTFKTENKRAQQLSGISLEASVALYDMQGNPIGIKNKKRAGKESITAPLLFTHAGFSGPAILQLSAWAARELSEMDYNFFLSVHFITKNGFPVPSDTLREYLQGVKRSQGRKNVYRTPIQGLTKRLWEFLLMESNLPDGLLWADMNKQQLNGLISVLTDMRFQVTGKATFKEEFVTAGGVYLKEVNFKRYESRLVENLFFVGEILDIDALTGGFNFQNAWTGGFIASEAIRGLSLIHI